MLTLEHLRTFQHISILLDRNQGVRWCLYDLLRSKHVGVFLSVLKLTFQTNILLY